MNAITVLTTKTVLLETDPLSGRVLRERVEKALEDEAFANFGFAYEYDEDTLQARYELTGDEALIGDLLLLLAEPATQAECRASLRAERIRTGFYRRAALIAASAASMLLSLMLLHESK